MSIQGGIWNRDGEPVTQETLVTLKDLVSNQYFDRNMYHAVGNLGILYCAFDVIPESRSERQPYHCRSGDLITWDGRLDNREELIAALDISPVATDVEILAAAFAQWGTQAFARLLGDWATSIWCTRD
ncbi:MAG TPA: hypothetical protein VFP59_20415, partial [Candidatus Angelobacter sp.]|nr:hypothetical protein [Candidatus Angelobacter sp.]